MKKEKVHEFGRGRSLYLKLLSYFFSLLVPIIVIGLLTYIKSANVIKSDFSDKIRFNVEAAADTIDIYIRTAQETSINFFYDDVVQAYLMPREEQTPQIRTELWKIPKIIQRSENIVSGFTDSIFVFLDDQDIYVSGGLNQFDTFFNTIYRYNNYDVDFWRSKLDSSEYIELLPMSEITDKSLNVKKYAVPIVMHNQINKNKTVMVINISTDAIEKTLKGNSVFNSTAFLVMDDQNNLIYDSTGFSDNMDFLSLLQGLEPGEVKDEMTFGGNKYILSVVKSNLYGWEYYAFTPSDELQSLTKGIMQMTVILCIVLVIMGIVFSFFFSSSIYNPIKSIRDIIVQKKDLLQFEEDDDTHVNEIEMIRSGVRSLMDNQLQYKVKYDRYTGEYVEYSFFLLMKGHTLHDKEILEETLKNEFNFTRNAYMCCSTFFDFKKDFYNDILDTERLYVLNGIKRILWAILGDYIPVFVMEYRQNMFLSVINVNADELGIVNEAFEHILSLFHYDEKYCDITVGMGGCFGDINQFSASFNEAMTAISKRNREKRFQIINSNSLSITENFFYSFYDEQKLLNCLKAGDTCCVDEIIDQILDKNAQKGVSYEHMILLLKELHMIGIRFMAERGLDAKKLGSEPMALELPDINRSESFVSIHELRKSIKDFFNKTIGFCGGQSLSRQGNLASMITQYIEENYMRDLCLEQIADEMGVSSKYVSRVFKETTGVLLTDFINEVRINKAKELLRDTDLHVQDISARIGIDNRTTFLRVFKKVEGVSPTVYRSIQIKGKE